MTLKRTGVGQSCTTSGLGTMLRTLSTIGQPLPSAAVHDAEQDAHQSVLGPLLDLGRRIWRLHR